MPTDAGSCLGQLDELVSAFTAAIRPRASIGLIEWRRVLGFIDCGEKADAVRSAMRYLQCRFHCTAELGVHPTRSTVELLDENVRVARLARWSPDALLSAITAADPSLVVLPCPIVDTPDDTVAAATYERESLGRTLDVVLRNLTVPVLLLKSDRLNETTFLRDWLVAVPGFDDLSRSLAAPFSLVEPKGSILLYHVIDTWSLALHRQALAQIAEAVDVQDGLEQGLREQAERALHAVQEQARSSNVLVTSQIAFGEPVEETARRVVAGGFGIVSVPAFRGRGDALGSMALNLALRVSNTPVLVT